MARKRHTAEKIIQKLREAEVELTHGRHAPEAYEKFSVTEQTGCRC